MFKLGNFEDEIYRSMEKSLVAAQTEQQHGFNKLAKAIDYLNAAASIFEQAGMQEESDEVSLVLQELASQFAKNANEVHHKKCNCEREKCEHPAGKCKNHAADKKAMYIGSICDECAAKMPKEYLK